MEWDNWPDRCDKCGRYHDEDEKCPPPKRDDYDPEEVNDVQSLDVHFPDRIK